MISCEIGNCENPAKCHVQWGTDLKGQQGNLCEQHIWECWELTHHATVSGVWIQQEPREGVV